MEQTLRQELRNKENSLYASYQKELKHLRQRFLAKHNTIKKGDIIQDHIGRIKVENIDMYNSSDPCLIFNGLIINTNGKANKALKKRLVYESNLI